MDSKFLHMGFSMKLVLGRNYLSDVSTFENAAEFLREVPNHRWVDWNKYQEALSRVCQRYSVGGYFVDNKDPYNISAEEELAIDLSLPAQETWTEFV